MLFLIKADDLFDWAVQKFEAQIMERLPEETTPEIRARLAVAFDSARTAVREGKADPMALQRLQSSLRESALEVDDRLSEADVIELTEALELVAGQSGEPSEESTVER